MVLIFFPFFYFDIIILKYFLYIFSETLFGFVCFCLNKYFIIFNMPIKSFALAIFNAFDIEVKFL